jgi:flagellar basal body rod protein FlgB
MASSDLAIDVTSWAMRLEQTKADTASRNIASANIPGNRPVQVDFSSQIDLVKNAVYSGVDSQALQGMLTQSFPTIASKHTDITGGVQLDSEVADLTSAELRYKTLAEALSRQLSLLSLAASGKQ